jgi:hypothetical protein
MKIGFRALVGTMRLRGLTITLACLLSAFWAVPALAATSAVDPTGDNCKAGTEPGCGPDFTGAADRVAADGTVYLSITRASSVCATFSYPATEVQPWFQIMSGSAASRSDTASNLGAVWAVSTTSDFQWSPEGGAQEDEIAISSTVTAGSVEVVIPASLVASLGGLPLKWYVNNSCKNWPWEPPSAYFDFAPDSGLYTLAGTTTTDACPNIAGDQASVPAGMISDGAGNCVPPPVDLCPNIAGDQASVPSGYLKDGSGNCLRVTINGTSAANVLIGNALANLMNGLGGNDRLYGRAANDTLHGNAGNDQLLGEIGNDRLFGDAGIDTARGGSGSDSLKGGAGKDRLYGDAGNDTLDGRDRKPGDVINGGAGRDVCYYNRGDIVTGCEKKRLRA